MLSLWIATTVPQAVTFGEGTPNMLKHIALVGTRRGDGFWLIGAGSAGTRERSAGSLRFTHPDLGLYTGVTSARGRSRPFICFTTGYSDERNDQTKPSYPFRAFPRSR